ncbi:MAG: tape measure protein [Dysgonomonas sp.]|uniref:tape measure protein n=1 Tax=Dysgonomonas sp. TaxID=1891233 RepID=UPI003A8612E1
MNIVEFALRLKDMASTPLRQFGVAAGQTFTRADSMVNNLTAHNRVLGQSYNQLHHNVRQVENTIRSSTIPSHIREARRELESLQRQASVNPGRMGGIAVPGGSQGGGMMGMMGMAGMMKGMLPLVAAMGIGTVVGSVARSGVDFIGESINKSFERQQIQTSFNVLAGSDEAGKALTGQLVGLQKDTVLGSEVFKNAQTMMGFGFKSNEVYNNLKMLGDVSMGDAEKLGSLTLAFSQVRAGGKLLGNDLIQFINAGFNPLEMMAQTTGKSIGVLKDEMGKGLITFGMVQKAFKDATSEGGRFNNMLGKIAETPAGKLQQLSGAWEEFKIQAGAAFMPLVSMALDLAQKVLPIVESFIKPLTSGVQRIADLINGASDKTSNWGRYANQIKDLFGNYILPYVRQVWDTATHIVAKMVEFAGKSELVKDIFNAIVLNIKTSFIVLEATMKSVKFFFDNTIMPMLKAIETVYRLVKPGSGTAAPNTVQAGAFQLGTAQLNKKGQETTQDTLNKIKENTAANADAAKNNESTISGGGQKIINIQMPKFLDNINIYPASVTEGVNQMEQMMREMFARILLEGAK